jgi:uncharacterized protein
MTDHLTLTEINIYPIKSLGGISLKKSRIEERGLALDRRWMLVDKENKFITQRTNALLSLLKVNLHDNGIEINNKEHGTVTFEFGQTIPKTKKVVVWDSVVDALEVSQKVNEYLSSFLNAEIRLVFMPDDSKRLVDTNYAKSGEIVSFADAFPCLLIGNASLTDLNGKLEVPLPMNRFRPNLVVNTSVPFDEDIWSEFSIGSANFAGVKRCARCVVTTIDQATGKKGAEPLKTLSSYRNFNNKVLFGQNVLYKGGSAQISLGDEVRIKVRKNI